MVEFLTKDGEAPNLVTRLARTIAHRAERIAVEASDGCLTYAELGVQVHRLANQLRAMGAGTGTTVGISLPRGARELVALLATLEAGAAYVPLDPSHPIERLSLVMDDAAPQVLMVHPSSPLAKARGPSKLVIEHLAEVATDFPPTPPGVILAPEQPAYIIFTSGSTGRPKGVVIPHRALTNFLSSMAHTPGMTEDDRLLAVTTTAFDIAGLELYLPLWVGGTVVIVDTPVIRDPQRLRQKLETSRITLMQATPAMWRLLLQAGWRSHPGLRMLCGGEAMPSALADRLLEGGGELWNMYGPTETTIWSSVQPIRPGYDQITIGRPIAHTTMVVVGEDLQPVPPDTEGELLIGGWGLALGYHERPQLTAERFVVPPEGERLYRTGDLARRLADGRFECIGRLDHQVKIEGFRVELGEIEARLRAVGDVDEVLVVADRPEGKPPRLVAYWTGTASRDALVKVARRWLPPYMVPTAWVSLDEFPLNENGKIDRHALPPPKAAPKDGVVVQRPKSDTEARIAAVWSNTLELPEIPRNRDFFTLGGTSALATEVITRLRETTRPDLPLEAIYEAPTIASLVERVRKNLPRDRPIEVVLRQGSQERTPLHCVLGVHLYQDLALTLRHDRTVVGMHVPFRYVPGVERRPSLTEVAERYIELVERRQPSGPYHLLGLCFGGIVAYEMARLLELRGRRVAMVTIIDAILPTAVQIDQRERLRSYAGRMARSLRSPSRLRNRLGRESGRLMNHVRQRWPLRPPRAEPVDLPIDGPEVDAEILRFARDRCCLDADLLVVRATAETSPPWRTVRRDQGWGGRALRVRVLDVNADHLGVLREPHVATLARALDELTERAERSCDPVGGARAS